MILEGALAVGLMGAANFADAHTTQAALSRPHTVEVNPLVGSDGSRVVPVKLAVTAIEGLVFHKIRKHHKRAAWAYVAGVVMVNVVIARRNSGMGK